MLTREEWDEAEAYWKNWLENFEGHVLPVFIQKGYSKDTALSVYALGCQTIEIEEIDEREEWEH